MGFGFVIHLLLDELSSVDLLNRRIKRSFGSALKIISLKYWRATLALALATVCVYSTVSYPADFYATAWHRLETHYTGHAPWLMPANGRWFSDIRGIFTNSLYLAQGRETASAIKSSKFGKSGPLNMATE